MKKVEVRAVIKYLCKEIYEDFITTLHGHVFVIYHQDNMSLTDYMSVACIPPSNPTFI